MYIPGNKRAGVSNLWTGPLFYQQWSIKLLKGPILDYRISEVGIWATEGHLGTSLGRVDLRVWEGHSEVNSRVI